ncbi:hypothetical protein GCM10009117_20930 [Gangjinia marincola]|uniref:Adhesin domain-containing protein n=2 Tax=Gangjinia marincola TaxID=578463 RepID=A0ABP3XY71_9FLAO
MYIEAFFIPVMKKRSTFLGIMFVGLFATQLYAQKVTEQCIDAKEIDSVILKAEEVFKISIISYGKNEIKIETIAEGEYYQQVFLEEETNDETLYLTSSFDRSLVGGYDKLSAHKVISFEITLYVPRRMRVQLESPLASLTTDGSFDYLEAVLRNGNCVLKDFKGNGVISTTQGNIAVEVYNTSVTALSKNGTAMFPKEKLKGKHRLNLISLNGDILITKK